MNSYVLRRAALAIAASVLTMASSAVANAACYEQRLTPASVSCTRSTSNSADFGANCTSVPASVHQVAVACPEPVYSAGGGGDRSGSYYDGADNSVEDAGNRN